MGSFNQSIYLKKNIKLSNREKEDALERCNSTKNIDKFDDFADLYYNYFQLLETDICHMKCYHEFSTDNSPMICLFLDIDIAKQNLMKPVETLVNIYNKENKISDDEEEDDDISDIYLLKKLIIKFCKHIYKNNKNAYEVKCVRDDDYIEMHDLKLQEFLTLCYKNLAISKNIMDEKYSYHVYFKNILFNINDVRIIKSMVKSFVDRDNNPFTAGIDLQVYKKSISLRTIYSKKNNDDDDTSNFHYPIYVENEGDKLLIEQGRVEVDETNLENYFCTINNIYNKNNYIFIHKFKDVESSDEDSSIPEPVRNKSALLSPNIQFLTLKDVLSMSFKSRTLVSFQATGFLENIDILNTNVSYIDYINKYKELTLDFNYNAGKCIYCKKSAHKNKHYITAGIFGINIVKKGNINSCKVQSIPYKTMTELKICEYIYKQGVVKKTSEGEIIYFTETDGWKYLENSMFSGIKNLMKSYYENFRNEEITVIDNMSDKKIKECFMTLTHSDEKINTVYPYMFKFKNGILDLKTNEFIPMKDSKHLYIVIGVNYDYKKLEDYTEDEMKKYEFLEEVINQIMPEKDENDEKNYYREVFECNVSSCLAKDYKDIVTVFEGPTLAGKSTIKQLICSSLGDKENFIDIPISLYANPINPKNPDPWLGQIENKCVSFASEPGFERTINTQTIKLLTESKILSRKLYSNDIGQVNFLSQFIDTNYNLKFDTEDPAVYRRWAVIKFKSHFQTPDAANLLLNNIDTCNKYTQIKSLKTDIIRNMYSLDFFHILYKWFNKYHKNGLKLQNTSKISPFYVINECINNMTIPGCIIEAKYLKDDKITNYTRAKYRVNYNKIKITIGTSKRYFINYFEKFLQYKNIEYNLSKLVSELVLMLKSTAILPFVLIDDIKEEYIPTILERYKTLTSTKNKIGTKFDLTYYNENKHIFNMEEEEENMNLNLFPE